MDEHKRCILAARILLRKGLELQCLRQAIRIDENAKKHLS